MTGWQSGTATGWLAPGPGAGYERRFNDWLTARGPEVAEFFGLSPTQPGPGLALRELHALGVPLATWPYVLTPQFLSRREAGLIERGVRAIMAGVDVLLRDRFDHDPGRIGEALRLTPPQREVYRLAPAQDWARIARPDIVFDASGAPWCLELNAGAPLGGLAMSDVLSRIYQAWPDAAALLADLGAIPLSTMDGLAREIAAVERPGPSDLVVIAYWGHEEDNMPPHAYTSLASELRRAGIEAVVSPIEELDLSGADVRLGERRVAALYRFFDESDGTHQLKESHWREIVRHIDSQSVLLIGNFIGLNFINKAFLALLSADADGGRLPSGLARDIGAVLPWTRILDDATADFALAHRAVLVLKPADGCAGVGVVFGGQTDEADWERGLKAALGAGRLWVVQRLIPPPGATLGYIESGTLRMAEYTWVTGAFFFGRRLAGAIRRCARDAQLNINPSQGAAQGCVRVY